MLATIREQHERIRRIFSFRVVNKGSSQPAPTPPDKEFKSEVENLALTSNNDNLFSIDKCLGDIKTSEDIMAQEYEYYEEYARKKIKSYKSLMNVPKEAHKQLEEIDGKFKEFETCWADTHRRLSEIQSLARWYRHFKWSYRELFAELQRRIQTETDMEKEVESYRRQLQERFDAEARIRNKFNADAIRYLPPAFHPLLAMNPLKYEIFPTHNISPLAGLSVLDKELFGSFNVESVAGSTIVEGPAKAVSRVRKTTL